MTTLREFLMLRLNLMSLRLYNLFTIAGIILNEILIWLKSFNKPLVFLFNNSFLKNQLNISKILNGIQTYFNVWSKISIGFVKRTIIFQYLFWKYWKCLLSHVWFSNKKYIYNEKILIIMFIDSKIYLATILDNLSCFRFIFREIIKACY